MASNRPAPQSSRAPLAPHVSRPPPAPHAPPANRRARRVDERSGLTAQSSSTPPSIAMRKKAIRNSAENLTGISGYTSQLAENVHRGNRSSTRIRIGQTPQSSTWLKTDRRMYWAFYFLGLATLIPWNFYITPASYWEFKFRNITANPRSGRTPLQESFESHLVTAMLTTNVVFFLIASSLTYCARSKQRVCLSSCGLSLLLIFTCSLVLIETDSWQLEYYNITIGTVVFGVAFGAIMQSGIFGLAATMDAQFMQAVVSGQAFCGTFASLVSLVSFSIAYAYADNIEKRSHGITYCTFLYFVIGVLCVFGCSVVMNMLPPEEELQIAPTLPVTAEEAPAEPEAIPLLTHSEQHSDNRREYRGQNLQNAPRPPARTARQLKFCCNNVFKYLFVWGQNCVRVLRDITPEASAIFVNLLATLTVFPSINTLIQPLNFLPVDEFDFNGNGTGNLSGNETLNVTGVSTIVTENETGSVVSCPPTLLANLTDAESFSIAALAEECRSNSTTPPFDHQRGISAYSYFYVPVFCFLFYNLADLLGREMASRLHWPNFDSPRWVLPSLSTARLVFIPFFMLCNVVLSRPRVIPMFFNNDAFPIVFTILLGLTNGYVITIAFTLAPRRAKPEDAEVAGTILCVLLAFGLVTGTLVSLVILEIL